MKILWLAILAASLNAYADDPDGGGAPDTSAPSSAAPAAPSAPAAAATNGGQDGGGIAPDASSQPAATDTTAPANGPSNGPSGTTAPAVTASNTEADPNWQGNNAQSKMDAMATDNNLNSFAKQAAGIGFVAAKMALDNGIAEANQMVVGFMKYAGVAGGGVGNANGFTPDNASNGSGAAHAAYVQTRANDVLGTASAMPSSPSGSTH